MSKLTDELTALVGDLPLNLHRWLASLTEEERAAFKTAATTVSLRKLTIFLRGKGVMVTRETIQKWRDEHAR